MKRVLFLVSYRGSGSDTLFKILTANPRIQMVQTHTTYRSPAEAIQLASSPHKLNTTAAIYGDHLLFNHTFCCSQLYKHCKFIYVIRPARDTLNKLVSTGDYTPDSAFRYYTFRLCRMLEMAAQTPGAVLLAHDEIQTGLGVIDKYLNLKTPLVATPANEDIEDVVDDGVVEKAQDIYEQYFYRFGKLQLETNA